MNECAHNFSFLYNKKILKEMKEEYFKTQGMNLHAALSDGNSHDMSTFSPNIRGLQENISAGIGTLCAM